MNSKERFERILKRQPVDRVALFEVFWREAAVKWAAERPGAMADGYVLQVDHGVSLLVEGDTCRFFVERGLETGRYT